MKGRLTAAIRLIVELWVQKRCLLTDHDGIREVGPGEVFERCQRCGRRSDGWQLSGAQPRQGFEGDPARHVLVDPRDQVADIVDALFEPVPARTTAYGFGCDRSPLAEAILDHQVDGTYPVQVITDDQARLLLMRTSRTKH